MSTSLILYIFSTSSLYAADFYQVELIIFEHENNTTTSDVFKDKPELSPRKRRDSFTHINEFEEKATLWPMSKDLTILALSAEKLTDSNKTILATLKWVQPAKDANEAPVISLSAEDQSGRIRNGAIKVYTTIPIFANLTLQIAKEPLPLIEKSNTPIDLDGFIIQTQRIKFKQIHYFDHAEYGVLISVSPYTPDENSILKDEM